MKTTKHENLSSKPRLMQNTKHHYCASVTQRWVGAGQEAGWPAHVYVTHTYKGGRK